MIAGVRPVWCSDSPHFRRDVQVVQKHVQEMIMLFEKYGQDTGTLSREPSLTAGH